MIESGTRITIFDTEDRCTLWAQTRLEAYSSDGWFEALINDAEHNGVGEGGWWRSLAENDEGMTWIRGWHAPHEPTAAALLAAGLLARSAA